MKALPSALNPRTILILLGSLILSAPLCSQALNLRDFLKKQSPLRASVKLGYLRELQVFKADPIYCSKSDAYPGMFQACKDAYLEEQQKLLQPDWGRDWILEDSNWVPTFGEVLVFRKSNILSPNSPMGCEATLSIPANKPSSKRFSFDIYCDH
jgi:hypothetical protein